jgi:hypothetical protein
MITLERLKEFNMTPQYMAGLFDGEGSVGVHLQKKKNYLILRMTLTQKDPTILYFIAGKFPVDRIFMNNIVNHVYQAEWRNEKALDLLNYIKNDCIIKYNQVQMALKFISIYRSHTQVDNDEKWLLRETLKKEKEVNIH